MPFTKILYVAMCVTLAMGQRPSFAGSRPIGYPEVIKTTTDGLVNKFGEDDDTTMRLPIEANGDRDLVDRLSKLPIDQQPFWFINWQAYEAHRQKPQTFPQKPNVFVDPANMNSNAANTNFNTANMNSNTANMNFQNGQVFSNPQNNPQPNQGSFNQQTTQPQPTMNPNFQLGNRNAESSDSLVPTSTEKSAQSSKPPLGNVENKIQQDDQYRIINGEETIVSINRHHY